MKTKTIGRTEISFIDIVKEAAILSQPKYSSEYSTIRKISDRITERKLNCLEIAEAYKGFYEKQYLKKIAFQNGNRYSAMIEILKLCPEFTDRYEILRKKSICKN